MELSKIVCRIPVESKWLDSTLDLIKIDTEAAEAGERKR